MRQPIRSVLFKQIYFTGIETLPAVLISGLLIGVIVITQISQIAGTGNISIVAKILIWSVMRELAPFLTAMIVILRSGTAIATEISTIRLTGEMEYLEAMAINPVDYLIKPRIIGVTISLFVLSIYFQITSIFGSLFLASLLSHIPFSEYGSSILSFISAKDVVLTTIKSILFGITISLISTGYGLSIKKGITEIPMIATKAVVRSFFSLFFIDVMVNILGTLI